MKKITKKASAFALAIAVTAGTVSAAAYAVNLAKIKGDVTGDGKVTQADAVLAARKEDGWDVEIDEVAADVDVNGKFDSNDVNAIAKYVAGWSDTSVGDSFTDADPIYTLSVKYRDDIDKSVQDNELDAAVADDEELMMRFLDGEFDDLSKFTKLKSGLTLAEAYAMARMLPDFYVDIDAGGEKAPMILTGEIDGYTGSESVKSVTLTPHFAGGKAPYTFKWYKGTELDGIEGVFTSSVTGDNFGKEVYCEITDADGNKLTTNKTILKNANLVKELALNYNYGDDDEIFYVGSTCEQGVVEAKTIPKYTRATPDSNYITLTAVFEGGSGYTSTFTPFIDEQDRFGTNYKDNYDQSKYSFKLTKTNSHGSKNEVIYDESYDNSVSSPNVIQTYKYTYSDYVVVNKHETQRIVINVTIPWEDFSDEQYYEDHTTYSGGVDNPTITPPAGWYPPRFLGTLTDEVTGKTCIVRFGLVDYEDNYKNK